LVLDVLDRTIERGRAALAESPHGREALHRYMHDAVDAGLGVVNIVRPMLDTPAWPVRRAAAEEVLERLTEAARRDGASGKSPPAISRWQRSASDARSASESTERRSLRSHIDSLRTTSAA
jgi:hypothetical protein